MTTDCEDGCAEWEMPCPAAGGIPCGSEDCLRYGCEDEREPVLTTTDTTATDLRAISRRIRTHQRAAVRLTPQRDELVLQALAEGWTHAQIAEATGLTRGRVGQLAAKLMKPASLRQGAKPHRCEPTRA